MLEWFDKSNFEFFEVFYYIKSLYLTEGSHSMYKMTGAGQPAVESRAFFFFLNNSIWK